MVWEGPSRDDHWDSDVCTTYVLVLLVLEYKRIVNWFLKLYFILDSGQYEIYLGMYKTISKPHNFT